MDNADQVCECSVMYNHIGETRKGEDGKVEGGREDGGGAWAKKCERCRWTEKDIVIDKDGWMD